MSSVLNQQQGIDAIHLISHGNDQGLQLGDTWLSNNNLQNYNEQLQQWSAALDADADLLIYGCELASSEAGLSLINGLAELTSADVAASDDLTGAASLGGDWTLEYTVGQVENYSTFNFTALQNWSHVLTTYTVTTNADDPVDSSNDATVLSLREAIILSNANAGADQIILQANTTYTLNLIDTGEDLSVDGDLDIHSGDLTIQGVDETTVIDANNIG